MRTKANERNKKLNINRIKKEIIEFCMNAAAIALTTATAAKSVCLSLTPYFFSEHHNSMEYAHPLFISAKEIH